MLIYSSCHHEPLSKISNLTGLKYICSKDWFLPWQFTLEGARGLIRALFPSMGPKKEIQDKTQLSKLRLRRSFLCFQAVKLGECSVVLFWNLSPTDIWKRYFSSPGKGTSSSKSAGWFWDMFFFLGPGIVFRWGLKEKLLLFQKKPSWLWFEKKHMTHQEQGTNPKRFWAKGKCSKGGDMFVDRVVVEEGEQCSQESSP